VSNTRKLTKKGEVMKKFQIYFVVTLLVFTGVAFAQGKISSGSNSASLETILGNIKENGREKTTFSVLGDYFDKESEGYDGNVTVNQKGEVYIQTSGRDKEELRFGPQLKIGNLFEKRHPDGKYVVVGIHSIDLNQDGLHDIVIEITDISAISNYGFSIATTKDFYFATGNGQFAKGKSKVHF